MLVKKAEPITLEECLTHFSRKESLEDYYCSTCEKHRNADVQISLWKLPKVLVIHLKRFDMQNRVKKINRCLQFDITNLILNDMYDEQEYRFNLYGCVVYTQ